MDYYNDKRKIQPLFETFPLAEVEQIRDETYITEPSLEGVKQTKEWVDYNEK